MRHRANAFAALYDTSPDIPTGHRTHNPNGLRLVCVVDDDAEAGTAQITFNCGLPARISDLDVIAQHPGVRLRALCANRCQRSLHVHRINNLLGFEPFDFLVLLRKLTGDLSYRMRRPLVQALQPGRGGLPTEGSRRCQ